MNELTLERIAVTGLDILQDLSKRTFCETYEKFNTPENMSIYLENDLSTDQLKSELNSSDCSFYFVKFRNEPVGFLKLNFAGHTKIDTNLKGLEIERIYILKEHQNKGIGLFLLNETRFIARSLNLDYIWLGVWENNVKARSFYARNGFEEYGEHVFYLGKDQQNDILVWHRIDRFVNQ